MRRVTILAASLALVLAPRAATPAGATARTVAHGSCSGPGHWRLTGGGVAATEIRVRFAVRDVDPRETWQIFVSDDDVRVFAGTRTSGDDGRFAVRVRTRNRGGRDHLEASAINTDDGGSCSGSVRL
jgi:uncharacterized protein (DUF1684 family)